MKGTLVLLTTLLLAPLALAAADNPAPKNDAAWLKSKGTLLFHDAFEREEDGNGLKAIGNGWESATADRVPKLKQADLDGGILKIASATKEAGHPAHRWPRSKVTHLSCSRMRTAIGGSPAPNARFQASALRH